MEDMTLTRRSFMKVLAIGSTVAAMSASLTGCMESVEDSGEGVVSAGNTVFYPSICHGCIAACPVRVYVKDGVVVKIEGHPDAPMSKGGVCLKAMNQIHTCYSPRRVLYPMRRTGARGANNAAFERITWDEAIEEATDRVADIIEKYGTYSFFSSAGGGGSYAGAMLPPLLGGQFLAPTGFEPGAAQCWLPRNTTAKFMYGGSDQSTADSSVLEPYKGLSQADKDAGIKNSMECLVIWGTQPSCSQTAQAGHGLAELRANGMKTIVVDPNFSPDASKATVHLPVRPGSDAALVLSWFRYIFENKLYDEEFTKFWTNLPCLINPDTKLPWLATEAIDGYTPTTPDDTPVYVCVDENTGEVAPLPFGAPEDVLKSVNPQVFATATVNGVTSKSAGQIYKEEAEPWTLERTEEFCWVPADRNRQAIEIYTAPAKQGKCAGITHGVATDQMEIASQMPLGLLGLDMIMGYVNKPGAALTQNPMAMQAAAYTDTNEWGKCAAAGTQARPTTAYTGQLNYGYVVGATEEANAARVAAADQAALNAYGKMWIDRLGLSNHRGLSSWGHSHIPAIREAVETGKPFPLKAWFELSGNKLAMLASSQAWCDAAIENVEFIFGQQPIFTSFHIELCDLFFPTEEWLEHPNSRTGQLNYTFACPGIIHLGETVNPMHPWMLFNSRLEEKLNARLDKIVFNGTGQTIAEMGLKFPLYPMAGRSSTDEECWQAQKQSFATMCGLDAKSCTNEELLEAMKNRSDLYTVSTSSDIYWSYGQHLVTAKDGLPVGFGTESRKCEVYCTTMIKLGRTGWPYCYPVSFEAPVDARVATYDGDYSPICRVPLQTEAPEVANSDGYILPFDEDFPLAITSGRLPFFHHGTMRHAAYARELYPAPFLRINPATAAKYGISDGDWVEVSSRRTQGNTYDTAKLGTERSYNRVKTHDTKVAEPIHAIAMVTEAVAPNVVWTERFWNPECYDSTQKTKTGGWQECSINVITNGIDAQFNEVFGSYNYRAFAVNVKKSQRPDRIWVQPEEFEPFMPTTTNDVTPEIGVVMTNKDLLTPSVEFDPNALNTMMGK